MDGHAAPQSVLEKEGIDMNVSCPSLGNLNSIHVRLILTQPSRFSSVFPIITSACFISSLMGEWGGIFLHSIVWLHASSQVTAGTQNKAEVPA